MSTDGLSVALNDVHSAGKSVTARALGKRARDSLSEALIPPQLRRRHRHPSNEALAAVAASLERNYFEPRFGADYLRTAEGKADHNDHLQLRLSLDRRRVVPWLNTLSPLEKSRVVEIGCGTGASTVAIAEQGARVVGYDLDAGSLIAARDRCAAYNVAADLREGNAAKLPAEVIRDSDIAVFFASIEHMTLDERLAALSDTWRRLPSGSWMVVIETPNRLWWFDNHTSFLPFYLWLPDDLAVHYAKYSQRRPFNQEVASPPTDAMLLLLSRIGRSTSFHEFQLALGDLSGLEIRSLGKWLRQNPVEWAKWAIYERDFQRTLSRRGPPGIAPAFYEPWLDLAIRKP
jgi:S-adenosylmethionine-dependent methyltransferase